MEGNLYQVLNESNLPASGSDADDLALFSSKKEAGKYVKHLKRECPVNCSIVLITSINDIVIG